MSRPSGDQFSEDSHDLRQNMDLSTRPLATLLLSAFARKRVQGEGYFHLGIVSEPGIAVLTRTNSVLARRIRVKSFSDLKYASTGKRIMLANNQSANITVTYNNHIYGNPAIKITWIQGCRRFEADLKVHNLGIY